MLDTYLCPKNTDYYISSNYNSEEFALIEVLLSKCSSGICQPDSVMNTILNSHYVEFAIVNTYFDYNDYENPVKTYLEDMNVYHFIPNIMNAMYYKYVEVLKQKEL